MTCLPRCSLSTSSYWRLSSTLHSKSDILARRCIRYCVGVWVVLAIIHLPSLVFVCFFATCDNRTLRQVEFLCDFRDNFSPFFLLTFRPSDLLTYDLFSAVLMVPRVSLVVVTQFDRYPANYCPSVNQSVPSVIGLLRRSVGHTPGGQERANQPISHARRFSAFN